MSEVTSFLPALKPGHEVPPAPAAGVWADRKLSSLAAGILVPPGVRDVHSVPDPWARMILFDRALFDETHSLHAQILGEWRGMLGILGLRERMGFLKLSVAEVNLTESNDPRLFSHILTRALPNTPDVLRDGESWKRFYLIRAMGTDGVPRPFGMTSPRTLVATGASYPKALTTHDVPWFRSDPRTGKTLLTDPGPVLSEVEKKALAEWVMTVRASLGALSSTCGGWMLKLLKAYAESLVPNAVAGKRDVTVDETRGLGLNYTLATILDKAHNPETKKLSDLVLKTDQPGAPRYILIDPMAGEKLGRDPKELVVRRDITLATVKVRLPDSDRLSQGVFHAGDAQEDEALHWCTPDFFFERTLIYEQNRQGSSVAGKLSDPFPGCMPVRMEGSPDPRRILLPLREDVVTLYTPDTLQKNFSVEWKSNGAVVCRLRLDVMSIENAEKDKGEEVLKTETLVLQREYKGADLVQMPYLPVLGVWPNFQLPDEPDGENRWKRYYLFESWRGTDKTEDFVIQPPAAMKAEASLVAQKNDVFQIHALNSYPQFLVCRMAPREASGGYQETPSGLLFLRKPETPKAAGNRGAALGIDFGTTGTSVYWSWVANPVPQPMQFHDRFVRLTLHEEADLGRLTRDIFIPAQDRATGRILSVFQAFNDTSPREVLDGHVLYLNEIDPANFITGYESGVRSNLKWGGDRENEAAMDFLTQLCIQSLAELVSQGANAVSIRYSYPTAFSIEQKARFIGIWARVIDRLKSITGIEFVDEGDQVENREAVAATRFFASSGVSRNFLISRGALTIDIGGGTTDIALWNRDQATQRPTLMAHLSVLFAGRDIFLKPIARKPSVLVDLDPSLPIWSLTDRSPGSESYGAQLDALISARGDQMLKDLPARQDKVKEFLAIMSTGLCGLGFYAGLLAGGLAKAGNYKPAEQIPVFVGGNGSRLLKWCAINFFQPGMPAYDKFAACVLQGCRLGEPSVQARVQIVLSPNPKEEVAYGLVAGGLGNQLSGGSRLQISEDYTNPLAGEDLRLRDGSTLSWSDCPTAQQLRGSALGVDHQLPVFRAFVKAAKVQIDEESLSYIADVVDDKLGVIAERAKELEGDDVDERALDPLRKEPVFIMALKKLVEMKIDEWVTRA